VVVAIAAIAIPVLATQAVLFSEPLFALLLAAAVILADAPPAWVSPSGSAALAGLAAALALLTRSIGVAAGAGIVLFLLHARRAPLRVALGAAAAVAVGGYGLSGLVRRSAIAWTLVCYFLILMVWPFPSDRFLWGVLPWLALVWVSGAIAAWRHPRLRLSVVLLASIMGLGYGLIEVRGFAGRW